MMEFSSPLAAMHPPHYNSWGRSRDLPNSRLMYSGAQTLAPNSFNFKDLSMARSNNDYFSVRPTRGSSPTASLAADLCSNFHIDQSPQFPTPRRSLFVKDIFLPRASQELLATPPVECEGATTPDIPSSSPAHDAMEMDVSPLPHKVPCFVARVTLPSPSPESEEDAEMLSPVESPQIQAMPPLAPLPALELPVRGMVPERRRQQRPGLTRSKGYSTTSIPMKTGKEALLPAFQFGNGFSGLKSLSTPALIDTLSESPIEEQLSTALNTSAPRRPSLGMASAGRCNGSPASGVARKSSLVPPRPRKQVRRSLSMFQHPDDVMKDREEYAPPMPELQPSVDVPAEYQHKLPHFQTAEIGGLPRIQQDTLIKVLNGDYNSHYDKVVVVDCRFEYEYEGGHINGAVNYNDKDLLAKELFEHSHPPNTLLIFHCEYSVHRAPRMAKFVRNQDRTVNDFQYPKLTYPEVYILEGGYSSFFEQHRTRCFPQSYVEMEHKDHERACEKGMGKLKQRAKLSRAQTFAFGQQSASMEDSPTAAGSRMGPRSFTSFDINADLSPAMAKQFQPRRLVTF